MHSSHCTLHTQGAAIGLMYLSTMAGALPASELAMYSALLMDSDNSEMIEFLMAGMWILLRNPENRKACGWRGGEDLCVCGCMGACMCVCV